MNRLYQTVVNIRTKLAIHLSCTLILSILINSGFVNVFGQQNPVVVTNDRGYVNYIFYTIVGEVENNSNNFITNIHITAKLKDVNGNLIGIESKEIDRQILNSVTLAPNSKVGFEILADVSISELVSTYDLSVEYDISAAKTRTLKVVDSNFYKDPIYNDGWAVVGEVKNEGNKEVTGVGVFAILYDSSNKVVGVGEPTSVLGKQPYSIGTGKTGPFSYTIRLPELFEVKKMSLYVDSNESVMVPESSSSIIPKTEQKVESKIPDWVRNIFIWYGEKKISEDEVLNAIKFLVKQGIIKLD